MTSEQFRQYIAGLRVLPILHPQIAETAYERFLRPGPRFEGVNADDIRKVYGERIANFRRYYHETYQQERARFPISQWRWADHVDGARTTNAAEG